MMWSVIALAATLFIAAGLWLATRWAETSEALDRFIARINPRCVHQFEEHGYGYRCTGCGQLRLDAEDESPDVV
jgi:endo-1,4-beta-D-glucanase Y